MFNQISDQEFQEIIDRTFAEDWRHYETPTWFAVAVLFLACVAILICGALFALMF